MRRGVGLILVLQTCRVHNVLARGSGLLLYCILHTSTLLCPSAFEIRSIDKVHVFPAVSVTTSLYIVHSLGSLLVMLGSVLP